MLSLRHSTGVPRKGFVTQVWAQRSFRYRFEKQFPLSRQPEKVPKAFNSLDIEQLYLACARECGRTGDF